MDQWRHSIRPTDPVKYCDTEMTDYYPLLRKAIDRLDRPSESARYNVYERGRQALVRQLRGSGILDEKLDGHLEALDRAVAQIEREFANLRTEPTRSASIVGKVPAQRVGGEPEEPQRPSDAGHEPGAASSLHRWGVAIGAVFLLVVVAAGFSFYHFKPSSRSSADGPPSVPVRRTAGQTAVASAQEAVQPSYILRRQRVFYRTTHPPGTITVSQSQRFLYVVQPNQVAIRYAIGIGSECEKLAGLFRITEKVPRPAESLTARAPSAALLPEAHFNPPALYFDRGRAVHEANDPNVVGHNAPAGCFQSWEQDIADLFDHISVNDRVVVAN
jgi:lipoprotein-anchoring transpeptidase ErfK/SrfK